MSIIIIWKANFFSIGKELFESILIFAKVWLILNVISFFLLTSHLTLSEIASYLSVPNNTKCLVPSQILVYPSIFSNLICNGFAPIKVFYEMS